MSTGWAGGPWYLDKGLRAFGHAVREQTFIDGSHPNDKLVALFASEFEALRVVAEVNALKLGPRADFSQWARNMRSLLGKWVTVTIAREPALVERSGVLHLFDEEGQVALVDETGCMYWMWPNLDCQETERPGG